MARLEVGAGGHGGCARDLPEEAGGDPRGDRAIRDPCPRAGGNDRVLAHLQDVPPAADHTTRLPALPGGSRYEEGAGARGRIPYRSGTGGPNRASSVAGELMSDVREHPATISLTPAAIDFVKRSRTKEGKEGQALRVGVKAGGCSGYSYFLGFTTDRRP